MAYQLTPIDYQAEIGNAMQGYAAGIGSPGTSWRGFGDSSRTNILELANSEIKFKRDFDMWNLQNEYNSPAAQMQRFKDAGLNPNLIYQQGNPGNATQAVQLSKPQMQSRSQAETLAKIDTGLSAFNSLVGAFGQAFSLVDQWQDIQAKGWENAFTRGMLENGLMPGLSPKESARLQGSLIGTDGTDLDNPYAVALLGRFAPGSLNGLLQQAMLSYKQDFTQAKTDWQKWYNTMFAPLLKESQETKNKMQSTQAQSSAYNFEMLNSLPAPFRVFFGMLMQMLNTSAKFF